jgi:phosphopantothenoylcysteine decarboxylase/phosphopantothenate--cysteine ligase
MTSPSPGSPEGLATPPQVALGVSGGIACYKAAEVVRRLQDRGIRVVVMMTRGATRFVTPLTFGALSGHRVYTDIFEGAHPGDDFDGAFDHIFVAQASDLFLVAPASADCIARLAAGIADDFLTTFHLAARCPLVVAPAMNTRMWEHPSVRANLAVLEDRGAKIIEPDVGEMACHTDGPGRLAEVGRIVETVVSMLSCNRDLAGRKILVTAGPTVEDIDPVRYISNRSSGKMGFAVARAVRDRGGDVILVSGPTALDFPGVIRVRTTAEMHDAVMANLDGVDAVIKAAAPLDFRPAAVSGEKIRKQDGLRVEFEPTTDILATLGTRQNGIRLVGFAAETRDHQASGLEKLRSKNLDLIVVNRVSGPDSAFDSDRNRASIIDRSGDIEEVPEMSKQDLAHRILDRLASLW